MPCGVVRGVSQGMGVLDFGGDHRRGSGSFGVNLGHPIVTNGDLRSSAEVRTVIELSFGVVSGVGPGIDVLDGVHVPQGVGAVSGIVSGICAPIRLNGRNDVLYIEKCIRLVCEKLTVFLYGQYIVGIYVSYAFW